MLMLKKNMINYLIIILKQNLNNTLVSQLTGNAGLTDYIN